MGHDSRTATFDCTTDAAFRAMGVAVNASLAAAGLTQTSDTGQINWTTVTAPVAGNTDAGYEVWRFSDTLHSTVPIFLKIYYGRGSASTIVRLRWESRSATSGAGVLSGQTYCQLIDNITGSSATGLCRIFTAYSGALGTFWIAIRGSGGVGTCWYCMTRWADDSEAPVAAGVFVHGVLNTGSANVSFMRRWRQRDGDAANWTSSTAGGLFGVGSPVLSQSSAIGTPMGSFVYESGPPAFRWSIYENPNRYRLPALLGCSVYDFTQHRIYSLTPKDTARNYLMLSGAGLSTRPHPKNVGFAGVNEPSAGLLAVWP
jgi:hypothetical protein